MYSLKLHSQKYLKLKFFELLNTKNFLIFCDLGLVEPQVLAFLKVESLIRNMPRLMCNRKVSYNFFKYVKVNWLQDNCVMFAIDNFEIFLLYLQKLNKVSMVSFFSKYINVANFNWNHLYMNFNKSYDFLCIFFWMHMLICNYCLFFTMTKNINKLKKWF